ncbi:OPT oligopeptide transporter protein-domain-containing protein [Yarrowia lipolytica]|nr:OPT oligopeptide transporter protein-domain-containing protein [Yarrowia lipolytica]
MSRPQTAHTTASDTDDDFVEISDASGLDPEILFKDSDGEVLKVLSGCYGASDNASTLSDNASPTPDNACTTSDYAYTSDNASTTSDIAPPDLRMVDQEQLLATIMLNCAGGTPYVAQNILVQYMPMFYNQRWAGGFGYGFLVILVTQFMGFGFSGLLRRVGAYPVTAMWPTVLPTLAVNKVLLAPGRKGENINGLFCLLFDSQLPVDSDLDVELAHVGSPPKRPFGLVTGSISGMGFNPVPTFDWNVITGIIEPILISFHSALNQYLGMFLSGLVTLAVYDCNSKWTRWIPINDNSLFDNTGRPFDVKLILTNYQFDDTKYRQYSPPYFSAASLVLYGANFALYPMAFVYSILCHWREMGTAIGETWDTFRPPHPSNYEGLDDPFCRIQKKHPDVPDWWGYELRPGPEADPLRPSAPSKHLRDPTVGATLVNVLVCLGVLQFQMHHTRDICTKENPMKFSCPNETSLFSASVI